LKANEKDCLGLKYNGLKLTEEQMSRFRLPLLSPLAGSSVSNILAVLKGHSISPKYYLKTCITLIFSFIGTLFHFIDKIYFKRKVEKYNFKESPVFILGHWRSGTTLLHNLLTLDPLAGYVTTYHAVFPNNLRSKWLFKTFMRVFMPKVRPGDQVKISINFPQEDEYALSNLTRYSFYHTFYFPTHYRKFYQQAVMFKSLPEDLKDNWKLNYQKLIIKALINTSGERAILKNPVNTGRVIQLLDIFPNAKFIFLIRNPVIVYLSTKKFFSQLFPTLNLEKFNANDIQDMIIDTYEQLLKDYLSDKQYLNTNSIIEIRYEEFEMNPLAVIQEIYKRFSFRNFEQLGTVFMEYLKTQKTHKRFAYSIHPHELDMVVKKLDFAMKYWNYEVPENLEIIGKSSKKSEEDSLQKIRRN
jgi:hypothetical protein